MREVRTDVRLREPVQQAEGAEQEGGQQGLEDGHHQGALRPLRGQPGGQSDLQQATVAGQGDWQEEQGQAQPQHCQPSGGCKTVTL